MRRSAETLEVVDEALYAAELQERGLSNVQWM